MKREYIPTLVLALALVAGTSACGKLDNKKEKPKESRQDDEQSFRLSEGERTDDEQQAEIDRLKGELDKFKSDQDKKNKSIENQQEADRRANKELVDGMVVELRKEMAQKYDMLAKTVDDNYAEFIGEMCLVYESMYSLEDEIYVAKEELIDALALAKEELTLSIASLDEKHEQAIAAEETARAVAISQLKSEITDGFEEYRIKLEAVEGRIATLETSQTANLEAFESIDAQVALLRQVLEISDDPAAGNAIARIGRDISNIENAIEPIEELVENSNSARDAIRDLRSSVEGLSQSQGDHAARISEVEIKAEAAALSIAFMNADFIAVKLGVEELEAAAARIEEASQDAQSGVEQGAESTPADQGSAELENGTEGDDNA